jgi:hypothetical protein
MLHRGDFGECPPQANMRVEDVRRFTLAVAVEEIVRQSEREKASRVRSPSTLTREAFDRPLT